LRKLAEVIAEELEEDIGSFLFSGKISGLTISGLTNVKTYGSK
jgi:hypothetical protein